jgi:hypothetical protein
MGHISVHPAFIQYLGLLSDLHGRKECDVCQKIYRNIENDTDGSIKTDAEESDISCTIMKEHDPYYSLQTYWMYVTYVSYAQPLPFGLRDQ